MGFDLLGAPYAHMAKHTAGNYIQRESAYKRTPRRLAVRRAADTGPEKTPLTRIHRSALGVATLMIPGEMFAYKTHRFRDSRYMPKLRPIAKLTAEVSVEATF